MQSDEIEGFVFTTLKQHLLTENHRELGLQIALMSQAIVMIMDQIDIGDRDGISSRSNPEGHERPIGDSKEEIK